MRLFDPARPKMGNGLSCYVDTSGTPIAAVQEFHFEAVELDEARPNPRVRVMVWLLVEPGIASLRQTELHVEDFAGFVCEWLEDPEAVLAKYFGFSWAGTQAPVSAEAMDL